MTRTCSTAGEPGLARALRGQNGTAWRRSSVGQGNRLIICRSRPFSLEMRDARSVQVIYRLAVRNMFPEVINRAARIASRTLSAEEHPDFS